VEDNSEVRNLIRSYLDSDYQIVEAADGNSGLQLARSSLPDLIICDVRMPGMDGLELCRTIRHDPRLDFMPIIMLTAKASESDRLLGLREGVDDYITKPFSRVELTTRIIT
jgi:DNA-binding response OmpR family regulator